jgi:pimeloyl-ACP methyl ester carboxylesterase
VSGPAPLTTSVVDELAVSRRRPLDAGADTPLVVLVHGAMDRAASFGRTMRRLGDLDVVAFDRRGYAQSGPTRTGTIDEHAADLRTVVEWARADQVVVVGHSLGGTVAAAASLAGCMVGALALFESPFPLLDESFDRVGGGAVQVGIDQGPEAAAEHFYRLMVGDAIWARLRQRDRDQRRAEGVALMAELTDLRDPTRATDPHALDVPVVVGSGGTSSAHLRDAAERLLSAVPHARADHLPAAGHGAHLTHPDEFARLVRDTVALATGGASMVP